MADSPDEIPQPTSGPHVNESFLLQQLQTDATSALSHQQCEQGLDSPALSQTSELLSQQTPEFLHKLLQAQYREPPAFQEVLASSGSLQNQETYNQPGPSDITQNYSNTSHNHVPLSPITSRLEPQPLISTHELQLHAPQPLVTPGDGSLHPVASTPQETLEMTVQQESPLSSGADLVDPDVYKVSIHQLPSLKMDASYTVHGQERTASSQKPLDLEHLQKMELDQWRKSGTDRIQPVLQMESLPRPLNLVPPPPQPPPSQEKNAYNKNHLLAILNQTLVQFCHDNLYFVEFAHITGRFSFNLDNRETMHLVVSQMTTPAAFQEKPPPASSQKILAPSRSLAPSKSLAPSVSAAVVPPKKRGRGRPPRGRGRPRKSQDTTYTAPVVIKAPPETVDDAQPGPSTSGGSRGRRAAVKAKHRMTQISNIQDPNARSDPDDDAGSASNFEPGDSDESEDDYIYTKPSSNRTPNTKRSPGEEFIERKGARDDTELAQLPAVVKTEDMDNRDSQVPQNTVEVRAVDPAADIKVSTVNLDENTDNQEDKEEEDRRKISKCEGPVDSSGAGDFQCCHCTQRFPSQEEMQSHVAKHKTFHCVDPACRDQVFYTRGEIRKHFRGIHGKGAKHLHRCKVCRQEFLTRDQLKEHSQTSHVHMCSVCGETFDTKASLKKHKDSSHLEMSCTICGRNFISRAAFTRHIRRHKEQAAGKIKCDECDKEFTATSSLFHHKKAMHRGVKPYHCEQCDMSFNFNNSLKLHKLKHSGDRPYTCDVCHKSYLTANHLKNHVQAVHSSHKAYECPICDKRFPYDNSLKLHMRLHTGDRPFMCSICSKTFVSRSALKVHEATHLDTKDFHCDLCNKSYKTEMLLHNHRRRHTEDGSRYMCDICGNTYMYKSNLEAHYDVHRESRNHECNICHKTFKTYPTLYSHYLVHSDKNPFPCSQCGKAFKTKERLKAHEVRHTGEKPYVCESCGSCFPDKGGLSKHKKTVHADAPRFGCPVCGKQCNRADNLRVHMKVHGNPALLKLSQEELLIKDKSADTAQKPDSGLVKPTMDPVVNLPEMSKKVDVAPSTQLHEDTPEADSQTIHTLEAPRGLEPVRHPAPQDSYRESAEVPGSVMGQLMHPWSTDSALHYQNMLLAQGYPTAGMVQAQALAGDNTDGRTAGFQHPPTQINSGHGQNTY